ncbi:MAG: bifunctional phosphopantothenoylcysteine decarboxylase/phosphopantothenate--cysteine ligase CoaBC [Nitrospirota bacterium]
MLGGKNILFGVTCSIAIYKSVDIVRKLAEEGAKVTVVMTDAACRFVSPLTFEAVSQWPVYTNIFGNSFTHISLARESDLLLIAPATANTINKLACGIADNLLNTVWLAYEGPALIAPAMNSRMYRNRIVQKNINELKKMGVSFIGPESGSLVCGEEGEGRLAETADITEAVRIVLSHKDLSGHNILVTAGPTREPADPVRFITNRSSGKMGFAIAGAAFRRGAEVTLISGPTALKPLKGISFVPVERAVDMGKAVLKNLPGSTAVIMAAAVSDFAPSVVARTKMPSAKGMSVNFRKTPDILLSIGKKKGSRVIIGFAAETGRDLKKAKEKLKSKNMDLIVMNDITQKGAGFDVDTNIVAIIDRKGEVTDYPLMKKSEIADIILDRMLKVKKVGSFVKKLKTCK